MNRRTHATQLVTRTAACLLILVNTLFVPVSQAFAAPTPPTAPETPTVSDDVPVASETPEAPEAPKSPKDQDEEGEESKEEEKKDSAKEENEKSNDKQQEKTSDKTQPSPTPTPAPKNNSTNGVGDSEIDTGDATTVVTANNNANTNSAATTPSNGSGSIDLANAGNGTGSDNTNAVDLSNNKDTVQVNSAGIDNNVEADSATGNNQNSANVGSSTTNTGDANTVATVITTANTNIDGVQANEFNIVDDYIGDIVLDVNNPCATGCKAGEVIVLNNGNGSNSNNSNTATVEDTSNTFQYNDANVTNDIILSADSGNNQANDNTGGDTTINTGDANVIANVVSFLNNNIAGGVVVNTVNIIGDLVGDIIAPGASSNTACGECGSSDLAMANNGNGSYSDNENSFSQSNSDLVIQDNEAVINNSIELENTTGNNDVSANTGGTNKVTTGDSNVDVNVINVANQNVVSGEWWIVLVNEAGNWVGRIMGAPEGANMAGSAGTEFRVNDDGSIDIVNNGNGSGSQNTNDVNQSSNTTIVQQNNATLNNNLKLSANTGNNSASGNTGGDVNVNTGDTNVVVNLVNFINNNISGGGKVNITVVNVLGSWLGNFRGPGYEQAAETTQSQALAETSSEDDKETAIGGYVEETEVELEEEAEIRTQVSQSSNPALLAVAPAYQGKLWGNSNKSSGSVLGSSSAESNGAIEETISGNEYLTDSVSEAESAEAPLTVKVTWPALFTSLLGIVYAGLKTRGIFFA